MLAPSLPPSGWAAPPAPALQRHACTCSEVGSALVGLSGRCQQAAPLPLSPGGWDRARKHPPSCTDQPPTGPSPLLLFHWPNPQPEWQSGSLSFLTGVPPRPIPCVQVLVGASVMSPLPALPAHREEAEVGVCLRWEVGAVRPCVPLSSPRWPSVEWVQGSEASAQHRRRWGKWW